MKHLPSCLIDASISTPSHRAAPLCLKPALLDLIVLQTWMCKCHDSPSNFRFLRGANSEAAPRVELSSTDCTSL